LPTAANTTNHKWLGLQLTLLDQEIAREAQNFFYPLFHHYFTSSLRAIQATKQARPTFAGQQSLFLDEISVFIYELAALCKLPKLAIASTSRFMSFSGHYEGICLPF
jgi:hypothetical protein